MPPLIVGFAIVTLERLLIAFAAAMVLEPSAAEWRRSGVECVRLNKLLEGISECGDAGLVFDLRDKRAPESGSGVAAAGICTMGSMTG